MRRTRINHPLVGIVANPQSGRDVRRLVSQASVFPSVEKSNMVQRILSALGSVGIREVVMMPDTGGITSRIRHTLETGKLHQEHGWPTVRFLEMPIEYAAIDTIRAVERMVALGVAVIIVMGGDGTHRVVSKVCGDTPIVAVSTGTNNTFPEIREATVAGLAAGLVAMDKVSAAEVACQNKVLHVDLNGNGHEIALVDLCVCTDCWVGTRALWEPDHLRELFVTFASPSAIGLSAIAGYLHPVKRWAPYGLRMNLVPPGEGMFTVSVPIAPGLMKDVGVSHLAELRPKEICAFRTCSGTIAFDGERDLEFNGRDRPRVWLDLEGPITIDIDRVMAKAAEDHLFCAR
ncbi:NAD(+)/NADH kinase [Geomonas sp. RF6]|uniref:ATP-NAD kinase family protein n=1 Tax=Geomonas sp. RF6 TaxID=2897342 RepID=UPI001E5A6F81|nr:NAD(+)/NADH kinase [Geomonas sp. RF6]UFS70673.1 NAD(+)/NADH kinase [Geomonas sp. RF6]